MSCTTGQVIDRPRTGIHADRGLCGAGGPAQRRSAGESRRSTLGGDEMVSAWWLVVTFMAGGMAGVLVMALMTLAADPDREEPFPPLVR